LKPLKPRANWGEKPGKYAGIDPIREQAFSVIVLPKPSGLWHNPNNFLGLFSVFFL